MSNATLTGKRDWATAKRDAGDFYRLFPRSTWSQWSAAGSVRRRCPEVGDVDHVVVPAVGELAGDGLFGATEPANLLWHHLDGLVAAGTVAKAWNGRSFCWGERHRAVTFRGFTHELWSDDAENWGSVLAIRTGPGEFSKRLVLGLQRHGYVNADGYVWDKRIARCGCGRWSGTFEELTRLPAGTTGSGAKWRTGHDEPVVCPACGRGERLGMARVPVPDEQTYFRLAGEPWREPQGRA
ncbi:MAG: hypothetical protein JWO31_4008 [Phycisphaerales bacterium]|nr:hypothetical protein [Phycisphaerales bacterium]